MSIKHLNHPNIVGFKAIYIDYIKNSASLVMDYAGCCCQDGVLAAAVVS